jgi:hypothetical protein
MVRPAFRISESRPPIRSYLLVSRQGGDRGGPLKVVLRDVPQVVGLRSLTSTPPCTVGSPPWRSRTACSFHTRLDAGLESVSETPQNPAQFFWCFFLPRRFSIFQVVRSEMRNDKIAAYRYPTIHQINGLVSGKKCESLLRLEIQRYKMERPLMTSSVCE